MAPLQLSLHERIRHKMDVIDNEGDEVRRDVLKIINLQFVAFNAQGRTSNLAGSSFTVWPPLRDVLHIYSNVLYNYSMRLCDKLSGWMFELASVRGVKRLS